MCLLPGGRRVSRGWVIDPATLSKPCITLTPQTKQVGVLAVEGETSKGCTVFAPRNCPHNQVLNEAARVMYRLQSKSLVF